MKILLKYRLVFLFILGGKMLFGQDIHFTQFYESPLYLNPAFTGHIEGSYRILAIYRSQWSTVVPNAYVTPGLSFDYNIPVGKGGNSFGIGLLALNDQTGDGTFNTTTGLVSFAFHLSLDAENRHYLSAGAQGGVINKRLDTKNITFGEQLNGGLIDPNMPTGEGVFVNESLLNPDLGAGLTWSSYFSDKFMLKVGGAYFHLLEPDEIFLGGDNKLASRIAVHLESSIGVSEKIQIKPHGLYNLQSGATELNAGILLGYDYNPDVNLFFGGGTRLNDAYYVALGGDYKGIRLGFSYDLNVSELNKVSNGVGGFEIVLGYTGSIFRKSDPILPAIRFF